MQFICQLGTDMAGFERIRGTVCTSQRVTQRDEKQMLTKPTAYQSWQAFTKHLAVLFGVLTWQALVGKYFNFSSSAVSERDGVNSSNVQAWL